LTHPYRPANRANGAASKRNDEKNPTIVGLAGRST